VKHCVESAGLNYACSQACVSGVAKLFWMNHMIQNMRAYFMLYIITIKWIICVHGKIEFSSISQRPRLSSTKILGYLEMQGNNKKLQKNSQGWQKAGILLSSGGNCHPMAMGLVDHRTEIHSFISFIQIYEVLQITYK